jgi:transcriptional regulator with XRE-family HTH domain
MYPLMIFDLKTYRLANGLSQQEMADLLGLKKSAVSMIENGKRQLPAKAAYLFYKLQQETGTAKKQEETLSVEPFFERFKLEHRHRAGEYIRDYIGDLKSEKHRLEKLVRSWTYKFESAGLALKHVEMVLAALQEQNVNHKPVLEELLAEKTLALQKLRDVTSQKPEIALIRLEGIKKELATAKDLLAKQQRFPVFDSINLLTRIDEANIFPPAGEDRKELPGGGE